jgi:carboxypeptidase Q
MRPPRDRHPGGTASRRSWLLVLCAALLVWTPAPATQAPGPQEAGPQAAAPQDRLAPYREDAARLIKAATGDDFAWRRLAELTDTYGARPSGSENLARAIDWAVAALEGDGLEHVRTEPVTVPRWVRRYESAEIVDPPRHPVAMLALGGSVPTPAGGIEAEVLPVTSFDDLRAKGAEAAGRIVLFDVPFTTYSDTVTYRTNGARAAAQYGAVAALIRAVGPAGLRTPHTGSVQYAPGARPIPAAAIAVEDANRISRLAARGRRVRLRLTIDAGYEGDAQSANVVAEIRGREKPDEIVLVGGHFDSWDVGTGASDDAVGCIVTWEALRLMKALGIRPRRTVRLVLWTNEEHGFGGATAYAARHAASAHQHVFALESDSGVFAPATLGFSGVPAARAAIAQIGTLLAPLGFTSIGPSGGGADIAPIADAGNVPTMAYLGDPSRYFVIHHTAADTVERIAPEEVSKAAAAIAVMTYVVAEMPQRLPK